MENNGERIDFLRIIRKDWYARLRLNDLGVAYMLNGMEEAAGSIDEWIRQYPEDGPRLRKDYDRLIALLPP